MVELPLLVGRHLGAKALAAASRCGDAILATAWPRDHPLLPTGTVAPQYCYICMQPFLQLPIYREAAEPRDRQQGCCLCGAADRVHFAASRCTTMNTGFSR